MAELQLVRINKDGSEDILEMTPVPDSFNGGYSFLSSQHILELEEHYKKTGKPKKSYVDVLYVTRRQIEREKKDRS